MLTHFGQPQEPEPLHKAHVLFEHLEVYQHACLTQMDDDGLIGII